MLTRLFLTFLMVFATPACNDDGSSGNRGLDLSADSDVGADAPLDFDGTDDSITEPDRSVEPDLVADLDASPGVDTCVGPPSAAVENASVPPGFCAWIWADGLSQPRGIEVADNGDVLVVERGRAQVTVLFDADGDGVSGSGERAELASESGLNHGIAIHGGFLYASSSTHVYRWPYTAGDRADLGESETAIHSIPSGGHSTRTLAFDDEGRLYVSIGSASNVDPDSSRARVRRFTLPETLGGGLAFDSGEVFADGLRNEVGLALDAQGRMWGVQNGVDNLFRADLGGDIHENNPAEELSLFAEPGRFYGYPYCWSEFLLPEGVGGGPGTQWAHRDFIDDGVHTDGWCQDTDNVVPPRLAMQAHSAPLDITFYQGGSFPPDFDGDAFVTFHGSWNRDVPTGYKLMRVRFEGGEPQGIEPVLEHAGTGDDGPGWPHRPVGVRTGLDGRLFVTSDASGVVIAVGYSGDR